MSNMVILLYDSSFGAMNKHYSLQIKHQGRTRKIISPESRLVNLGYWVVTEIWRTPRQLHQNAVSTA